jgi:CDP-glycerol glycerophosphotransferase
MINKLAAVKGQIQRRRHDIQRRNTYKKASFAPLRNAVLFESFQGKVVGDSPFAIASQIRNARPALKMLWTVQSPEVELPDYLEPVVFGSDAWLTAMATSKYLVNNAVFPWYFTKRTGQIYVQTWHGTPLKRIVNDVTSGAASRGYRMTVTREAQMWDFLVSPSEYCNRTFASAFSYSGKFLRGGYPRNDRLVGYTSDERDAIRRKLGIPTYDTKVVLYAPTWRPNLRNADGSWSQVDLFDVAVPEDTVVLYRGHTNTSVMDKESAQNRIDVTKYPDVNELMIAADVLVTDFSSIMFDFSITQKPFIVLAPDIAQYRQDPGFYFELADLAPAPIVNTAEEVLEELSKLPNNVEKFREKYATWREMFTAEEDGHATQRVISTVFTEGK